jgi:GT2 family glycosyltransferase
VNSKAIGSAPADDLVSLCRIGENLILAPAATGEGALAKITVSASRHMDIIAHAQPYRLYQVPADARMPALPSFPAFLEIVGASAAERLALLRALIGTALPMFRLETDAVFAALVADIGQTPDLARATIHLDTIEGCDLSVATVPSRARLRPGDVLVSLAGKRRGMGRIVSVHDFIVRPQDDQQLAVVSFSGAIVDGDHLCVSASRLLTIDMTIRRHRDAEAFFNATERLNHDSLSLYAQADPEAGAILNRLLRQSQPRPYADDPQLGLQFFLDNAVPMAHGLFVNGWFNDCEGRIASVDAVDHQLPETEISENWKLSAGVADIHGKLLSVKRFAAFLPAEREAAPTAPVLVRVLLDNGESHLLSAVPQSLDLRSQRAQIVNSIAGEAFTSDMLDTVYTPALAPLQAEINARQAIREVRQYGVRSARSVSIVIPLYREIGFFRSQLMAFAVDDILRAECEIVFVLDDPPLAGKVASLLEGFALTFPLDIKLVVLEQNGGYALANNMGASQAEGDTLVLLNSDVIPDRPGWVEAARQKLASLPAFSVVGPKLVFADGTLQHAGMYFHPLFNGEWQNFHFWKGYGRHFPPADRERIVPAVTGACMVIAKADYLAVGGFTTDYVIGDYEDSDLCLKLRDKGGVALYMPSLTLHHFERQSMPMNDDRDLGSTVYNRALHTRTWGAKIAAANAITESPDA